MQNLKDMKLDDLPAETQKEIMAIMVRAVSEAESRPTPYVNVQLIADYVNDGGVGITPSEHKVLAMAQLFNEMVISIIEQNNQEEAYEKMVQLFGQFIHWNRKWKAENRAPF